jgi:hypothetical protein
LDSGSDELTLTPSRLLESAVFADEIVKVLSPGHVENVRLTLAEHSLQRAIPSSRLEIRRSPHGSLTIVELPNFLAQFDVTNAQNRQAVHDAVFGAENLKTDRMSRLRISESIVNGLKELSPTVVLTGPFKERDVTLVTTGAHGSSRCAFRERAGAGWFGYVHRSGLAMTFSDATDHKGQMVHWFKTSLDSQAPIDLQLDPELWSFLESCAEDARVAVEGEKHSWPLDQFGEIVSFGFFARYLRTVTEMRSWPPGSWLLELASRFEVTSAMEWLVRTRDDREGLGGLGMVNTDKDESTLESKSARLSIPVCVNSATCGLITWLRVEALTYLEDGQYVGWSVNRVVDVDVEVRAEKFVKKSPWPELVVSPEIEPYELGPDVKPSGSDASTWGCGIVIGSHAP